MIDGLYVLTKDDHSGLPPSSPTPSPRATTTSTFIRPHGSGTSHYWVPEGEYYTIPYRSLIPKGFDNLMVVGRCISSTHEAQASYRIMPIVACIGEGGGTVLAAAAKADKALRWLQTPKYAQPWTPTIWWKAIPKRAKNKLFFRHTCFVNQI